MFMCEKNAHPYGHGPCLGDFAMDSSLRRGKIQQSSSIALCVPFMEYVPNHFFNILHSGTLRQKGPTHSIDKFSMGPPSQWVPQQKWPIFAQG